MAFMLPALGGLLGSMLFKEDGGKVVSPPMRSEGLQKMMTNVKQPLNQRVYRGFPKINKLKTGGKVNKKKKKGKK